MVPDPTFHHPSPYGDAGRRKTCPYKENQPPLPEPPPLPPGAALELEPELELLPTMMFSFAERPLKTSYDVPSVNPRTTGTAINLAPPWRDSTTKAGSGLTAAILAFWLSRSLRAWRA